MSASFQAIFRAILIADLLNSFKQENITLQLTFNPGLPFNPAQRAARAEQLHTILQQKNCYLFLSVEQETLDSSKNTKKPTES